MAACASSTLGSLEERLRRRSGCISQVAGGGVGRPADPLEQTSLHLLCSSGEACASRDCFALMGSHRRPRRFVPWLVVSLADRDLLFQDSRVFSGGSFPPLGDSSAPFAFAVGMGRYN